MEKDFTSHTRVGEIISFCDLFSKKLCRQQYSTTKKTKTKKTPTTRGYFRNCELPLYP